MKVKPIHHVPMKPEYNSPFSAAYSVQDAKLIFWSGCCTVPLYHKHPHVPEEEEKWLKGDIREQTERTFKSIKEVLNAAGADFGNVIMLTIYMTDISGQNILNEISRRYFGPTDPPGRTLLEVKSLAHPGMLIEIDGVAAVDKE
jgi:enamine deaminase RidA (YjgF/YER057c/UK114 family)